MKVFREEEPFPSFITAEWEQITGFSIAVVLLGYREREVEQSSQRFSKTCPGRLMQSTYFIRSILVSISLLFRNLTIDPAIKLLFVAPLAVILSFLTGAVLVRIPGVKNIIENDTSEIWF